MYRAWLYGLLGFAGVLAYPAAAAAQAGEPLKPYILFVADVSGSMNSSTGHGSPSCATGDTRLNHLKCALANIVNGYGDMVMALGRFRQTSADVCDANGCAMDGVSCGNCSNNASNCTAAMGSGDRFELLVPLVENNQADLLQWVDFTCGTCGTDPSQNPELYHDGATPIAGSLKGAKRYFQGLDTPGIDPNVGVLPYWQGAGSDPIRNDPLRDVFVGGEQCRPYIVIMLTDGSETCVANFSETTAAAAAMLGTDVDGRTYRIETKPIGFGQSPGDAEIEALAQAGGAANGPGNEGFYAQNEQELSLAISQIIQGALKFEVCNGVDDDCDLLVDEGFASKNGACDDGFFGICRSTGTLQCSADGAGLECIIDTPGLPAVPESCNGLDDDCDRKVDEGNVCAGGGIELCDSVDNDQDGAVDENLSRACGTNVGECTVGVETCQGGIWVGCTGVGPTAEVCDGLDNNCDGTIDGFAQECTEIAGNQPGVGLCRTGTQVCPSDGSGVFGPCLGEVGPSQEACDVLDNDCDGAIDEDTDGDACNGSCGVGITECVAGNIVCRSVVTPGDEVCDGLDNDCDTVIDEDVPLRDSCDGDGTLCVPGMEMCISGAYQCVGGVPRQPETCDCEDNDCDGATDEEPPALCPTGASCVSCQCAYPCALGEFPCPLGYACSPDNFCLADPCFGVTCEPDANGDKTECINGTCVRSCDVRACPTGLVCVPSLGICGYDDCRTFPDYCQENEVCVGGTCVADPCSGVMCPAGEYCTQGVCARSCADVECPAGERCELGVCKPLPCGGQSCGAGRVCNENTGQCEGSRCNGINCPVGQVCDPLTGQCEGDPCLGVSCPGDNQVCVDGSCYDRDQLEPPDAGMDIDYVTPGGGGCSAGPGGASGPGALLLLLLGLFLGQKRRRRAAMRGMTVLAAVTAVVTASGCDWNSYPLCLSCPDAAQLVDSGPANRDGGPGNGDGGPGNGDGGAGDGGGMITDAGIDQDACPGGTAEYCDNMDNDCDGRIDEGMMPGVGRSCSSNVGECVAGITQCVAGSILCSGVLPAAEQCDGLDNDCDSATDEGIPATGSCGLTDTGECTLGERMCVGGVFKCVGATYPAVEQCDALDHDCDGFFQNGFNLQSDARNCGACGVVCQADQAVTRCSAGSCEIAVCQPLFWDLNGGYADGCEYGPCSFQSPQEGCNQVDDDCDGIVDEGLVVPDICLTQGACGAATPVCTAAGWRCTYGPDVQVDGSGDIVPETLCDDIDNDCDGLVDEGHPLKDTPCDDGDVGVCRSTGTYVCDPVNPGGAVVCAIDTPGIPAGGEQCNNLDDDCDGAVDEGEVRDWVSIGGAEMFAYEASRPDANGAGSGTVNTRPCSKAGVLPWTNITRPDAEIACSSIGGRLCTEVEWQRACKVLPPGANPVEQGGAPNYEVFIEAEDYVFQQPQNGVSWVLDTTAGYSGAGALRALPNTGAVYNSSYVTNSPRLDYNVNFTQTGTYHVWVRGWGANNSDDTVHVGLDGAATASADRMDGFSDAWTWSRSTRDTADATLTVTTTGLHTVNVWMREDGFRIDAILLSMSTAQPSRQEPGGCGWSQSTNCDVYAAAVCNGLDYDWNPGTPDVNEDGVIATGALGACFANWGAAGGIFDMSGNVKEWTAPRMDGINPLRGGSTTSAAGGLACDYSFTVADDTFFFPNVGFRCCR